ncbi:MAG: hypothetical protein JWQ90_2262 [Hydrocarboniphaga sp.]|uniref:hypothetical protein n=1 Tax=Hydrocarboniphaga sp. TaxID=2033016 RepID=UPI002633BD4D|nr:hypothetical protein [Hydrocarboniphaga sp.]MDB5969812.1 hypothetical protein [Hydrocarboniphaga sp.]
MNQRSMWIAVAAVLASATAYADVISPAPAIDLSAAAVNPNLFSITVGCPWVQGIDADNRNTGFPDKAATYYTTTIPLNPKPGTEIEIRGGYPKVRYFSLQSYDGFRPGNLIDSLPDALIQSDQGNAPQANAAVLPDSGDYQYRYNAKIKYEDKPATTADREPNTLYVGHGSTHGAFVKNIVFRAYLPNPGVARPGPEELPHMVQVGPDGEIDFENTPDQAACKLNDRLQRSVSVFPALGGSDSSLSFDPVTQGDTAGFYPNGDAYYLRARPGRNYSDMVVVRLKSPQVPAVPPEVVDDPEVRFWSICQYTNIHSSVVDCIADRNAALDADGYANIVISTEGKKPDLASSAQGYDWLPWGDSSTAMVGLRQLLVRPDFAGSYGRAVAEPEKPIAETLGEWAPEISYCDSVTFAATAAQGGAALMAACKAAFVPLWSMLGTVLGDWLN